MSKISIDQTELKQFTKKISSIKSKQIPYAIMLATNNLAFDFLDTHKKEIGSGLNWKDKVPNALRIKKATKSNPVAEVYVDEWNWGYYALKQHYTGGDRSRKGLEKAMIYLGYMYKHEILTPPPGARVKVGIYNQIKSQLKLNYKAGYDANETEKSWNKKKPSSTILRFFIITGKSKSPLAPGIYARMPGAESPICILRIAEKPTYKKKFNMEATLDKVYKERGQKYFEEALTYAISTAK